jgi:hypothetical protein
VYRGLLINFVFCLVAVAALFAVGIWLEWSPQLVAWLSPVALVIGSAAYGKWSGEGFPPRAPH